MVEVNVVIEIAKGGHIKYEYDKEKGILVCDRILHTPFKYPFNYGFIPNTLSEDKDPIDAILLMDDELVPGCSIKCKILGYLDTSDSEGNDPKLIVCPIDKIDPTWKNINNLFNDKIDIHTLKKIKYFFEHYKDLEGKTTCVKDFHDSESAIKVFKESVKRFNNITCQNNKITDFFSSISEELSFND
jgi:inorganic pyrophosphatase